MMDYVDSLRWARLACLIAVAFVIQRTCRADDWILHLTYIPGTR